MRISENHYPTTVILKFFCIKLWLNEGLTLAIDMLIENSYLT